MVDGQIPDFATIESPPRRPDIEYGMVKNGKLIGSGGQATVKKATLPGPKPPNTVAVKQPQGSPETLGTKTIHSFFKEAKTWAKLAKRERNNQYRETDHIVGIVAIGDELPWVAMEYMGGGSLADRLDAHPQGLPVEEALWITDCLCKGLKLAHDHGVAHLDLKPANVLFRETPDDTWDVPKIADWGLARTLLEESGSMEAVSVEYAAPEQFDSDQFGNPDTHTDIYQLGVIIYEMLTGRPPYTGGQASIMHDVVYGGDPVPPSARRDAVPDALDEVVMRALSADKSQRYRGAIELFDKAIQKSQRRETTATHSGTTRKTGSLVSGEEGQCATWSMFQNNPARTGSPSHSTGPTGGVTESWRFETGGRVEWSPAVVDGTVYVGSNDNNVYALDAATGTKQWAFETGDWIRSSPAVVDGTVYVGSKDGNVYALDAASGEKQWQFETDHRWGSSLAVVDGTVYVGSSHDMENVAQHIVFAQKLHALDVETGKERWAFESNEGGMHGSENLFDPSPAVVNGTVYFGSVDGNVYALNTKTGSERWSFETGDRVRSSPAVVNGTVYVGSYDHNVYALDAATGAKQWAFEINEPVTSSLAVVDGTVYVVGNSYLHVLDAETGKFQWSDDTVSFTSLSPAVVNSTVYVGSNDHNVYALDAATGTKQWAFETGDTISSAPAVANGTIYVGSKDGNVYALESSSN